MAWCGATVSNRVRLSCNPNRVDQWEVRVTFEETLQRHLRAIRDRDLDGLVDTVAPEELVLVSAAGDVSTETRKFIDLHREWFESSTWSLESEILHLRERGPFGTCLIGLHYRDIDNAGDVIQQDSILSLMFERIGDRWLLVQDQNTPVTGGQG